MIAQIIDYQTIEVYDLTQFDIVAILHSGQVFRYFVLPNGSYLVISGKQWAELKLINQQKIIIKCSNTDYFWHYFDLDTDYNLIKTQLSMPKLKKAMQYGGGIRILQADFIEMVISFIISANNNIKRFTKTLNDLCELSGTRIKEDYYAFPTLSQLTTLTISDFRRLGCGYRDQYLVKAVQQLQKLDFATLNNLPTSTLRQKLLQITGVGPKVAACVLLFAFHRLEIAPVDTWIKKAITQLSAKEKQEILNGQFAGVAQQYIFYYLQHLHREQL